MTDFTVGAAGGAPVVEGVAGAPMLASARDTGRLLEACFGAGAGGALLYAENLPADFFDLSSGLAGELLQKLATYGRIRLAVVVRPGAARPSSRFGEMAAEARWKGHFALFDDAESARAWLAAG